MILLALASVLLLGWSWFLDKKRRLFWLVLAVALVQALVSGGLYFLSIHPPESLKSKVLGPGLWVPFADAKNYFFQSQAWIFSGTPNPGQHPPSSLFVTLLGLTGLGSPQPFVAALSLNGLFHLFLLPLTYFFLRDWGEAGARRVSAGLGCLPSSLIYGSQLLREPLIWLLLFGVVGSLLLFDSGVCGIKRWLLGFGLVLGAGMLTEMRIWVGYSCGLAAFLALWLGRKKFRMTAKLGVIAVLWLGIFLGQQKPVSRVLTGFSGPKSPSVNAEAGQEVGGVLVGACGGSENVNLIWSPGFTHGKIFAHGWRRIGGKWAEMFRDPPFFFAALLLADVLFLVGWHRFLAEQNGDKGQMGRVPPAFSALFLTILTFGLAVVCLVFADTLGNCARYFSLVFLLLMPLAWLAGSSDRWLVFRHLKKRASDIRF